MRKLGMTSQHSALLVSSPEFGSTVFRTAAGECGSLFMKAWLLAEKGCIYVLKWESPPVGGLIE
jgi:hypothetical protein